jgi:hypothetical protein
MSIKDDLENVRDWAKSRIEAGQEPPWAWYQYMKLIETTEAILAAQNAVKTECSPQLDARSETRLRLVAEADQPGTAQRHPNQPLVQLPM